MFSVSTSCLSSSDYIKVRAFKLITSSTGSPFFSFEAGAACADGTDGLAVVIKETSKLINLNFTTDSLESRKDR